MEGLMTLWSDLSIALSSARSVWCWSVAYLLFLAIHKVWTVTSTADWFGAVLANIQMLGLLIQEVCFTTFTTLVLKRYFPLLIFMGVGAMTDFGALIAKPKAI